jgi:hypothetical protein
MIRPVNDPSISYEGVITIGGGIGAHGPPDAQGASGAAETVHGISMICKKSEILRVKARDFFMKKGLKNIPKILGIFF